ncbi:hypothetical protein [Sediminivirga luteola]|uniref:hypothetical protein n=1 Tax=Sediminivirga luteola TaxID=1774748 RepID=UPI001665A4C6|nr:hypothetical protein [Sediminivirga luteola]MCI2266150.1 hypothetical protein [Sediminivirga luteola]
MAALGATAGLCMTGASRRRPPAALMTAAAVVNLGWVVACTSTLHRGTGIGKAAMVVTATFDATAATLQWILRPDDDRLLFEHLPEDLLAKAVTS